MRDPPLPAAGLQVPVVGIGAWAWGDRSGYWGYGSEYGREESRQAFKVRRWGGGEQAGVWEGGGQAGRGEQAGIQGEGGGSRQASKVRGGGE